MADIETTTPAPIPEASPFPPLPRFQVKPGEFYGKPAEWMPIATRAAMDAILSRKAFIDGWVWYDALRLPPIIIKPAALLDVKLPEHSP